MIRTHCEECGKHIVALDYEDVYLCIECRKEGKIRSHEQVCENE